MTTTQMLKLLADAADDMLVNVSDTNGSHDSETGKEWPDYRRLRVLERLARRQLRIEGSEL